MYILALDIGKRRTGAALGDTDTATVVALDTMQHGSDVMDDVAKQILTLAKSKHVQTIVLGLPLLLSSEEGSQTEFVREIGTRLQEAGLTVAYLDERYTTAKHSRSDGDAKAACQLMLTWLERRP